MKRKTIIIIIIFMLLSLGASAEDVNVFYKRQNITDEISIISNDGGSLGLNKRKIKFSDLKKFNLEIDKYQDEDMIIFNISNSNKKIKLEFSNYTSIVDEKTRYNLEKLTYNKNGNLIINEGTETKNEENFKNGTEKLNFIELTVSYDFKKNAQEEYELYIPLYNVLKLLDFDLKASGEGFKYKFDKLEIYQPNTFAIWEEQERKELNKKRDEKYNLIKNNHPYLEDQTLEKIKELIFEDDKMVDRVLNYLEENPDSNKETIKKLFKGEIWFGMGYDELIAVKGKPKDINRTQTEYYIHEQWVYSVLGHEYYYFENGKLVTIQN